MGKSPDEQLFLAAYKLRLASANSMVTPLIVSDGGGVGGEVGLNAMVAWFGVPSPY